jgi:DNA-binding NtrC family response regulator
MRHHVIIFSPDFVRGNILVRRIARENVEVTLHDSLAATWAAIQDRPPTVVVFDSTGSMAGEVRSLPAFAGRLSPDISLLVLGGNAQDLTTVDCACRIQALPGVIDPEAIATLVRDECARETNPASHPPAAPGTPKQTVEAVNLEEDLVAFLKLG